MYGRYSVTHIAIMVTVDYGYDFKEMVDVAKTMIPLMPDMEGTYTIHWPIANSSMQKRAVVDPRDVVYLRTK